MNRVLLRLEIRLNILARLFPFDPGLLLRNSRHDISNSARWRAPRGAEEDDKEEGGGLVFLATQRDATLLAFI